MDRYPFPEVAPAHEAQPFVLETRMNLIGHERVDLRPAAHVLIRPSLRTSGLLASLSDAEAKLVLAMLTFVTPNGAMFALGVELAEALGISLAELKKRASRMLKPFFRDSPVLRSVPLPEGSEERYSLSASVMGCEHLPTIIDLNPKVEKPLPALAGRDAVIQASREQYNQPREVVERIVQDQLGVRPEETADTPKARLWRGLRDAGLLRDVVDGLLDEFGEEACQRQLEWLPLREAKNPSRYLVAAIKGNYGPPRGNKLESVIETLHG